MLGFKGFWGDGDELPEDKGGVGFPWEKWVVIMCGQEAEDFTDSAESIKKALRASGYELIARNTKTGEETVFPPREKADG